MLRQLARKKRLAIYLLICLTVFIFIYRVSRPKVDKPWLDAETSTDDSSLTEEMVKAARDPMQFYQPQNVLNDFRGLLSPIANTTFVMLYLPAPKLYSMGALHHLTTLERFPHHQMYSEIGGKIGNEMVIDSVSSLPIDVIKNEPLLNSYRIQRYGIDNNFNWPIKNYWVGSIEEDSLMELISINIIRHAFEHAPASMDWFVLLDDQSYISSHGLQKLLENENPGEKIVKIGDRPSEPGKFVMVLSRTAVESLLRDKEIYGSARKEIESKQSMFSISHLETRNISTSNIKASGWCATEPSIFSGLDAWEVQSLYHREMQYINGSAMVDFYHDYIMPYMVNLQANWVINPSGPYFNETVIKDDVELDPRINREDCIALCEQNEKCLGWQWRNSVGCGLELDEVKRGIAYNPKSTKWEGPKDHLFVSGWMIDRIQKIRTMSQCDDVSTTDEIMANEGWFHTIRGLIKLQGSEVLQSINRNNM